ncbi:MAG: GAF domain-containing SpoIIE family protein phosphatase [Thermodesulfovibrionales bacterium]
MTDDNTINVPAEYLKKLERKVEGLSALVEISEIISSTHQLDELMNLVMERAKKEMGAEACSILFYNKQTNKLEFEVALCSDDTTNEMLKKTVTLEMGQGIAGWVAEKLEPLVIEDVRTDKRFFGGVDKQTGFTTESMIAVPLIGRTGLIGVAEMINPRRRDYDPEVFQLLCRQFAIAIENAILYQESIKKERIRQELEIAAVLQKSFLPALPHFEKGNLRLSAVTIPAAKIGGDLYDFIEPVDGKVGVLIGDVSGKGVTAALYMAKAVSDFRYTARLQTAPGKVFDEMTVQLGDSPRGMFLTAIYMIVDLASGSVRVASAGHPPFLWITNSEVRETSLLSGPPLGILPLEYPSTTIQLSPGDRLLLFTDGLFDAQDHEGERLGFGRLLDFVKGHLHEERLIEGLMEYVVSLEQGADRADDITIVDIRWQYPVAGLT